jgi:anti-sigma factor RsiW
VTVHEHVQQVLSAFRDGEADPDQWFLAERHLGECARCQAAAAAFDRVDEQAREVLLPNSPAPSFEAALRVGGPGQPVSPVDRTVSSKALAAGVRR